MLVKCARHNSKIAQAILKLPAQSSNFKIAQNIYIMHLSVIVDEKSVKQSPPTYSTQKFATFSCQAVRNIAAQFSSPCSMVVKTRSKETRKKKGQHSYPAKLRPRDFNWIFLQQVGRSQVARDRTRRLAFHMKTHRKLQRINKMWVGPTLARRHLYQNVHGEVALSNCWFLLQFLPPWSRASFHLRYRCIHCWFTWSPLTAHFLWR